MIFFSLHIVCTAPQWKIALIVVGASAMFFTLIAAISIIMVIVVNSFHSKGELCEVVAPLFTYLSLTNYLLLKQ